MSLRNLTVRARNLIGFGLLGLILLVVGLTALKQINSLREQALEIRDVWMQGLDWMGQIKSDRVNIRLQESLAMSMPDQIETFSEEIQTFKADVDKLDRLYESTIIHDEDRRLFDAYRQRSQTYESALRDVLASLRSGNPDLGSIGASQTGYREMIITLDELVELNRQGALEAGQKAEASADQSQIVFTVLLVVGLLLTLFTAWLLSRSITAPLEELKSVAARIAGGDLSQAVRCEGSDEITDVQRSLEQMQGSLRDTLHAIQGSATQLASAAEEMHAITEQTSRGIHQQNEEIQMAATAVTEMSAAVDEVARNANHTSDSSRDAEQTAQAGRKQVGVTRDTIVQLTNKLDGTSATTAKPRP